MRADAANHDVLQRRQAVDQMVLLENHSRSHAVFAQRAAALKDRAPSFDGDIALCWSHQAVQASQQRRFAGSRWAEQHKELTLWDGDTSRQHRSDAIRINQCDLVQAQHRQFPKLQIGSPRSIMAVIAISERIATMFGKFDYQS